jgi:ethanolaminephosphotransferase
MFCRRRTRQSGPLGELFDHGVDALNTSLEVLLFSAAMNFGQGWKTVLVLFGCTLLPKCLSSFLC